MRLFCEINPFVAKKHANQVYYLMISISGVSAFTA